MPKKSLSGFVVPMQALSVKEHFDSPDWIFETKLDWYRAIAVIGSNGEARIWSRNRLPLESKFRMVLAAFDQANTRLQYWIVRRALLRLLGADEVLGKREDNIS
jgi:ATP-dependent DNA ligase